jgi:hypothetical protein
MRCLDELLERVPLPDPTWCEVNKGAGGRRQQCMTKLEQIHVLNPTSTIPCTRTPSCKRNFETNMIGVWPRRRKMDSPPWRWRGSVTHRGGHNEGLQYVRSVLELAGNRVHLRCNHQLDGS